MTAQCRMKTIVWFVAILLLLPLGVQAEDRFSFVALGDMPYGAPAITGPAYKRLIAAINKSEPAFSIHVGDIKSGSSDCSDEEFHRQRAFFDLFKGPLIYTPGDNEWTDCHRKKAGEYDPLERLAVLRKVFYNTGNTSLGARPIILERQSASGTAEHPAYVENQRWQHKGILFMTAHIVGSNNGFQTQRPAVVEEYLSRSRANRAWIEEGFRVAEEINAKAVVLAIHADVFIGQRNRTEWPEDSGFTATMLVFRKAAEAFGKPVLLIHGDSHEFRIDKPFTSAEPGKQGVILDTVTRLEVFGAPDVHAVRIMVDLNRPTVFGIAALYGPGNRSHSDD